MVFIIGFVLGAVGTTLLLIRLIKYFTFIERERISSKIDKRDSNFELFQSSPQSEIVDDEIQ